ncbi:MAG: hypothetical protein M1826_001394 [Phylliscum demangeonii]|nr:MAG: hypothetical protein M1826_001394 [Phylliscum demangeonii]
MASFQPAAVALDGGDPRMSHGGGAGVVEDAGPDTSPAHGSRVTFEEYYHYAAISRAQELHGGHDGHAPARIDGDGALSGTKSNSSTEKDGVKAHGESTETAGYGNVTDSEWATAHRATRTATWMAVFYLITTDILGPYTVPWAFAQLGYGPGIALYAVFGALAGYTGWQLWQMYLHLDSDRYPLRTYGEMAYRVLGNWARYVVNVLQSIQLLFNVGVIILSNSQGLSQVAKDKVCFSALCVIWTVLGMGLGQIRTLQRYGWVANAAIWLNVVVLIMTMAVVAHSVPNYHAALTQNEVAMGPVLRTAGVPPGKTFEVQVVGLMQAVYSYGGAMLFVEFMSEMRRPFDFWKGMLCAQVFIFTAYLLFGTFVYSYQGQFVINPANQGISIYSWQTVTNVISLVAALIAAGLYGNIGIKVLYQTMIKDLLHGPELTARRGKLLWAGMVPTYWALAFVIASAVPQFSNISALVAAVCILQFTYTFPPILMLAFDLQRHAMLPAPREGFDPVSRRTTRLDAGWRRWSRGFARQWPVKLFNLLFALGAAATAVLGIYSAVVGLIHGFRAQHAATSFGCKPPV